MEAIILGNPYDIDLGSTSPIVVPAYTAEEAVIVLSDGYNPYIIGGTTTITGDQFWFRYGTGILRPLTVTDKVIIGGSSVLNSEIFRVVGKGNFGSIQLGSSVTITSILDEDDMLSNSDTSVPTQQSVKAYVDHKISITGIQPGDNISLLTNNVGYISSESDPIFSASPSFNISSTQISHWDTSYGWGNHALAGYLTSETDPIFTDSPAFTITLLNIADWNLAVSESHTHNNFGLLETLIASGSGTNALTDDGTYKPILSSVAGSDSQVQFNSSGSLGASSSLTFNTATSTVTTVNVEASGIIYIGDISTNLSKNIGGDLVFTDANSGSISLATIIGGATNYWTTLTGGIYYTNYVGINNPPTLDEALTVNGNIQASDFNSTYLRYKNSNLLLGPNAGDNETGSNLLYIANTNTSSPLIYGDFNSQSLTFNADVYINQIKRLNFGNSDVYVRRDSSNNLIFRDLNANGGAELTLTDITTLTGYALKSDFISYTSVTSITAANKTTWNKASVIVTSGDGSKYLGDDGIYYTAAAGGVTPTDNFVKWDTGASYYRFYTDKTEAGGVSSGGKFYLGTDEPTNTNRLTYDGLIRATQGNFGSNSANIGLIGWSGSSYGAQLLSTSGIGAYVRSNTGVSLVVNNISGNTSDIAKFQYNLSDQVVINTSGINIITGLHYKINGINLAATDVGAEPTLTKGNLTEATSSVLTITGGTSSVIGSGTTIQVKQANTTTSGYLSSTDWNTFNNKQTAGNYITALTGEVTASGPGSAASTLSNSAVIGKVLTGYTVTSGSISDTDTILQAIQKLGYDKHVATTVVTTNGLSISGQQISIAAASTSTTGALTSTDWNIFNNKKPLQSTGLTFNPSNPVLFDKDYQYNSYTVSSNITITASLTGAVALNSVYLTLVGDGVHTVSFSGILPDPLTTEFNNNTGAINEVKLFFNGTNVYYTIPSLLDAEPYLETPAANGYILSSSTANIRTWVNPLIVSVPSQAGNAGKYLSTDGTNTIWATASGTGSLSSGLLSWNVSTNTYEPYSVQGAGHFDNTGSNPQHNNVLNYDGFFNVTRIAAYGYSGYSAAYFNNTSGGEAIIAIGGTKGISAYSSAGVSGEFITDTGKGLYVETSGSTSTSTAIFEVYKKTQGSANSTGTIVNIIDNPTSSGTISGSAVKVTIGSTVRTDFNPRVPNGSSAVAYTLDTHNTLTGTAKLISLLNAGTEMAYVDRSGRGNFGSLSVGNYPVTYSNLTANGFQIYIYSGSSILRTSFVPDTADSSSAIPYLFDTSNTLATAGSKMLSVQNHSVERFRISPTTTDIASGASTTFSTIGGTIKDFYTDASTSGTSETDLYSYTIPANVLANNGDKLIFTAKLDVSSLPSSSYIKLYFAGSSFTWINGISLSGFCTVTMHIIRVSSSICRIYIFGGGNSNIATGDIYSELTSKNWTTSNILKITGQCSTGTIIAKFGYIEYKPAGLN